MITIYKQTNSQFVCLKKHICLTFSLMQFAWKQVYKRKEKNKENPLVGFIFFPLIVLDVVYSKNMYTPVKIMIGSRADNDCCRKR